MKYTGHMRMTSPPMAMLDLDLEDEDLDLELEDDSSNPLFGDEDAHSIVDRESDRIAATPRAEVYEIDAAQAAVDLEQWHSLKRQPWGRQLAVLKEQGWVEPSPEYDELETQLGRRVFLMENGFGTLVKAVRKKRGWGPSSVECVEGGKKMVILRVKGKEMGTPFLISPAVETREKIASPSSARSADTKSIEYTADPVADAPFLRDWATMKRQGWGQVLNALTGRGWEEPHPEYNEIDTQLGRRVFVMEHGFGTVVKVTKKKRGWGPCSVECVDGGRKMVILRLKGKEMGTPFLISPGETGTAEPGTPGRSAHEGAVNALLHCHLLRLHGFLHKHK